MSIVALGLFSLFLGHPGAAFPITNLTGPQEEAARVESERCTECKEEMKAGWRFCPWDGVALRHTCPKCKKIWGRKWSFCPEDGAPLGKGAGMGKEKKATNFLLKNTPDKVVQEFIDALKTKNEKLLDGLIHWESYHESYLGREKLEEKKMSLEAFMEKVHKDFLNDAVQEKVKNMVKRFEDGNSYNINGDSARFRITLVNPGDSTLRMSNTFDLRNFEGVWMITDIT